MRKTGKRITRTESRHFNSIARHLEPHCRSLENDAAICAEADWEGMDRGYILGKIADMQQEIIDMGKVFHDMLPTLEWEEFKVDSQEKI